MLRDRTTIIADCLAELNLIMAIHELPPIATGSPTFNKLCGHIDKSLAAAKPKNPVGRPKIEKKIVNEKGMRL